MWRERELLLVIEGVTYIRPAFQLSINARNTDMYGQLQKRLPQHTVISRNVLITSVCGVGYMVCTVPVSAPACSDEPTAPHEHGSRDIRIHIYESLCPSDHGLAIAKRRNGALDPYLTLQRPARTSKNGPATATHRRSAHTIYDTSNFSAKWRTATLLD